MATARREGCWPVSDLNWPPAQPGVGPRDGETVGPLRAPGTQPWEHPSPLGTQARHGVARRAATQICCCRSCCSVAQSCPTLRPRGRRHAGFPVLHCLPECAQTHVRQSVTPSSHLILCRPLLLLSSIFPSIRVFANE